MANGPSRGESAVESAKTAAGAQTALVRAFCAAAENLLNQDRFAEAKAAIKQALQLAPLDAAALNILGVIELQTGDLESAAKTIGRAVELQPTASEPRHYLGLTYSHMGRYDDAVEAYRGALALRPASGATLSELANVLKILGRLSEARDALLALIELRPDDVATYKSLSEFASQSLTGEHILRLERIAADPTEDTIRRATASFSLAAVHESRGDFDAEFFCLKNGNDLCRDHLIKANGNMGPGLIMPATVRSSFTTPKKALAQIADFRAFVEAIFNADFIRQHEGTGHPSNLPIFIVGMNRSGSSLIEQVLSSHPMIHGAGEIGLFANVVEKEWPYVGYLSREATGALRPTPAPPRHFRICGSEYVKSLRELNPRAQRIVNKMLANYLHVGMIHLCLPNAVIVHAIRDPIDTCLGCYKRLFAAGNETTYDLALLGQHYQEYRKLMAHWRRVLPNRVIDVVYEDLVTDPEGQIRRLLELCRLPWDERCLRSHENTAPVSTHSYAQVRRAINRDSLHRWRRYEKHLGPLIEALGPYAPSDHPT